MEKLLLYNMEQRVFYTVKKPAVYTSDLPGPRGVIIQIIPVLHNILRLLVLK